jgi:hypothetical protein
LSGTVTNGGGTISGATVWLGPVTSVADDVGHYQFIDVEEGLYDVDAEAECESASSRNVAVIGESMLDLGLTAKHDSFGYSCDTAAATYVPGGSFKIRRGGSEDLQGGDGA